MINITLIYAVCKLSPALLQLTICSGVVDYLVDSGGG